MTLVATQTGLYFPNPFLFPSAGATAATLDAATEKYAMFGYLYIDGRPAGTKTLSTGTIQYRTGAVTFANVGTTVDIGIQGVATGAGPIGQPDGSYSVKTTLTGGGGGISANAWNTATMNSGTWSPSHGDLVAIVWDMTARGGAADSVVVTGGRTGSGQNYGSHLPNTNAFVASAWQTAVGIGAAQLPNAIITFDDGTLGWIDGAIPFTSAASQEAWQDSSNPDERGLLFQVPWSVKIDAFWLLAGATDANADFTVKLYQTPTSAISLMTSKAILAENLGAAAGSGLINIPLATEIALAADTDYALTLLATGTSNSIMRTFTLGNTAHRVVIPGGTTLAKVTRNGSSGNLAAESPAITMYGMGVRTSQFDKGGGSGGGSVFGAVGGVIA